MQYKKFGSLEFEISSIGFGGAGISGEGGGYGFGHISESEAISLVHAAKAKGINLFDTAPIYGFGLSEERLGKALKDGRQEAFLVSKCGVDWDESRQTRLSNSAATTKRMLEDSLRRLQTDYIDLYMIHWPDGSVPITEPMQVLAKAKAAGKIRAIGLCNTNPEDLAAASEVEKVDVVQAEFNLFQYYPKKALFPLLKKHGVGFMSWGTLDKGILTGRVTRERTFDAVDARASAPWWVNADLEPRFKAMDEINKVLAAADSDGLRLALGYVLQFTEVSNALCGVRNEAQLDSLVQAATSLPSREVIAQCIAIAEKHTSSESH